MSYHFVPYTSYEDYIAAQQEEERRREEEARMLEGDRFDSLWDEIEGYGDEDAQNLRDYTAAASERGRDTLYTVGGAMNVGLEGLGIKSEPEMFTLPTIPGISEEGDAPTLYKSWTAAKELGAAIFGDDPAQLAARDERLMAQDLYEQEVGQQLEGIQGGKVTKFAYQATEALTQELPFLALSGGTGTLAKAVGGAVLKKAAAKKIAKIAADTATSGAAKFAAKREVYKDFVKGVGDVSRKTSVATMSAIHAVRGAGGTLGEASDILTEQNLEKILAADPTMNLDVARDQAYIMSQYESLKPAIASGVITGTLVNMFGATGIERVFANPVKGKEIIKDWYSIFTQTGKEFEKQARHEFGEEYIDSYLNGVLAQKTFDPKRTDHEVFSTALNDGLLGWTSGGGIGSVTSFAQNFENWVDTKIGNTGVPDRDVMNFEEQIEGFIRKHGAEFDIAEEDIPEAVKQITSAMTGAYDQQTLESEGLTEEEAKAASGFVEVEEDSDTPLQVEIPYVSTEFDADTNRVVPTEGTSSMVNIEGRIVTLVSINGMMIPFYLSTGDAGKTDVEPGKWYPFFGIGNDGWLNKTSQEEINNFYNSPALKEAARQLNETHGDIRDDPFVPEVSGWANLENPAVKFINNAVGLTTLTHEEAESNLGLNLRENINDIVTKLEGTPDPVMANEQRLDMSEEETAKVTSHLFAEGKADAETGLTESALSKYNRLKREHGEVVAESYIQGFNSVPVEETNLAKELEEATTPIGEPTRLREEVVEEAPQPVETGRFQALLKEKAKKDRASGTLDQAREAALPPTPAEAPTAPTEEGGLTEVQEKIRAGYQETNESDDSASNLDRYKSKAKGLLAGIKKVAEKIKPKAKPKPKPKTSDAVPVPESVFKDLEKTKRFLEIQEAPEVTEEEEAAEPKPKAKAKKGPKPKLPETEAEKAKPTKTAAKKKQPKKTKAQEDLTKEVEAERAAYTDPDPETIVLANQRGQGAKRFYPEAVQGKKASEEYDTGLTLGPKKRPLTIRVNRQTGNVDIGFLNQNGKREWAYRLTEEGKKQVNFDTETRKYKGKDTTRVNGAIVPQGLITEEALTNRDADGNPLAAPLWEFNEGNKKIPAGLGRVTEELARKGRDVEFAEEIVGNIKDDGLRGAMELLLNAGLLSEEGINSIILATNRYRKTGAVYPRTITDAKKLGQLLENSISLLAEGSRYTDILGKSAEGSELDALRQASLKKLSGKVVVLKTIDKDGITKLSVSGRTMYLRKYKEGYSFAYDKKSIKAQGANYSNVTTEEKLEGRTLTGAKKNLAEVVQADFEGMHVASLANIVERTKELKGAEETQAIRLDVAPDQVGVVPDTEVETAAPETDESAVQMAAFEGKVGELIKKYIDVISNDKLLADTLFALKEEGRIDEDGAIIDAAAVMKWAKSVDPNFADAIAQNADFFYRKLHGAEAAYKIKARKKGQVNGTGVASDIPIAKGKKQLEELLSRDDTGLTEEQKKIGLRMLQKLDESLLASLQLKVTPTIDSDGNTNITTEGSFNSLINLAKIATEGNTSPDAVAEEVAHFTAKLLPEGIKKQARALRNRELVKRIARLTKSSKPTAAASVEILNKIQAEGEVTSQEYTSMLPDVSEADLNEIIQDTYYLANSDEYYANGLVNRNNQGVFKRGIKWVGSVLDAILAAAGFSGAKGRKEVRKFFDSVEAVFKVPSEVNIAQAAKPGGLIFRENVEAASLQASISPHTLEGAVQRDLDKGMLDKAKNKIRQSKAIIGKLDKLIRKHIAADANDAVRRMLNMSKSDRINALAEQLLEPTEYEQLRQKFIDDDHPELAQATALYSFEFLKIIERRAAKLGRKLAELEKELNTPAFQRQMKDATMLKTKAEWSKTAEGDALRALTTAIKLLSTQSLTSNQAKNSAIVQAVNDMAVLQEMQKNVPDLNNKVKELVDLLYKSVSGQEILLRDPSQIENTPQFANEIFSWLSEIKKGLGETITKSDRDMYRVAAALVASNSNINKNMLAVVMSEDPDMGDLNVEQEVADLLKGVLNPKTRTKSIRDAMRDIKDLTTQKARAQLLLQQTLGPMRAKLRNIANTKEAFEVLEQALNDPEFVEYRKLTALQSKAEDRPEGMPDTLTLEQEFAEGWITIPVPPNEIDKDAENGNVIRVQLMTGGKGSWEQGSDSGTQDAQQNIKKLKEATLRIQEWLNNNPDSPYYDFYKNTLDRISKIYLSELVLDHTDNSRALPGKLGQGVFLGIMDAMLEDLPTKWGAIARKFVETHNAYFNYFSGWQARNMTVWRNKIHDAADSHGEGYQKTLFGDTRTDFDAIKNWNEDIGRELRASWQEGGMEYKVGDQLSNGLFVTQEDYDLVEFEASITEEAYRFNEEITKYDESIQPQRIKDLLGIRRLAVRTGKFMLPRTYSGAGIEFIKDYARNRGLMEENEAGENRADEVFDALFTETEVSINALISFISDRNPDWLVKSSPSREEGGVSEEVYNAIADEIRDGTIEELSGMRDGEGIADAIAYRIAQYTGTSLAEAKKMFMSEIAPTLESLLRTQQAEVHAPEGDTSVTLQNYRAVNPFETARKKANGPYFFYDYGFNNDFEFGGFAFKGAVGPAANVITALKSAERELAAIGGNQIEVLERKYAKKFGANKRSIKVQLAVAKELGLSIKAGGLYLPVREYLILKRSTLGKYIDKFEQAFTGVGSTERAAELMPGVGERIYSSTVGGVLMSVVTLARNLAEAPIHGGLIQSMLLGNGALATSKGFAIGMAHALWQSGKLATYGLARGAVGLTYTAATKGLPAAIRAASKQTKGFGREGASAHPIQSVLRALIHPIVNEIAGKVPQDMAENKMLAKFGLEMPITPAATAANFDNFPETGGRIVPGATTPIGKFLTGWLGQWEAGIALIGRPVFPRMGDAFGNNILSNLGYGVAHELQKRARVAYVHRKESGESLTDPLTPEELIGSRMQVWKGNKASYNEMRKFLGRAGITNLEQTVQDYWARLAANDAAGKSNEHENLFTAPQRDRVATIMVTTVNMATPSNRPLQFRTSSFMRWTFSLMGWPSNAATLWSRTLLSRSGESAGQDMTARLERLKQTVSSFTWIAMAMSASIPENYLFELLMREIELALFGRHRITRLPHEISDTKGKAFSVLGLATNPIPFVGGGLNAFFQDLPGRAIATPGNLVMGKIGDVTRLVMDVSASGWSVDSATVHGKQFIESFIPISKAVTRFHPVTEGMNNNLNTVRLIRRYFADRDQVRTPVGFSRTPLQASKANELTAPKKIWAGLVGAGDLEGAKEYYNKMVEIGVGSGRYANKAEAKRHINSALRGITPVRGAMRSMPSKRAFWEKMNREGVPTSELNEVKGNLENWEKAFRQSGVGSVFSSSGSSRRTSSRVSSSGRATGRRTSSRLGR